MNIESARTRRHLGSESFRMTATFLMVAAATAEGVKIASDRSPTDAQPQKGVCTGNPYSAHRQQAMELDKGRGAIRRRDPNGKIVVYPGFLDRLYWPPGRERRNRLTPEDIRTLAAHLDLKADRIDPDRVIFEAMILTPDREARARIEERNHHVAAPPPWLSFDRQAVPVTAGQLMAAAPREAVTSQDQVLKCIADTCHKQPEVPGMVGHGISEARRYDPHTYGDVRTGGNIGFSSLPALPEDPQQPAPSNATTMHLSQCRKTWTERIIE
jgi:hypothetical protein